MRKDLLLFEDRLSLIVIAQDPLNRGRRAVPDPVPEVLLGDENRDRGVPFANRHLGVVLEPELREHLKNETLVKALPLRP